MFLKGIGIASHPPVIVPEVGRGKELQAEKTVRGIKDMALAVAEAKPEIIVCITPHGNVFQDGVSIIYETKIEGDLSDFGAPTIKIEKTCDMGLLEEMNRRFAENDCETLFLNEKTAEEYKIERKLDHGCLVPLYYIDKVYKAFKIVHITIGELSLIELFRTGRVLREAIEAYGRDTVILASADLSHCLKDEGPYHYNEMGPVFDKAVTEGIAHQDYYSILTLSPKIYEPAGQCGLRPIVMALGATDSIKTKSRLFSYEGPFGVGYLSAFIRFDLEREDPINESLITRYEKDMMQQHEERLKEEDPYIALARKTIDTWIETGRKIKVADYLAAIENKAIKERLTNESAGVFVTLYKVGELRGCIGTLSAATENLAEEIVRNAIEASTYDPRFLAVEAQELYQLEIEVDILGISEEIDTIEALDPKKYGLIIEKGLQRGVLLPNITGITTAEEQITMVKRKAGIMEYDEENGERLVMQRFEVERHQTTIEF
ncbi:MAG: AmmeMemoRadiSam system protein A [Eubacterium sp.]